MTAENNGNGTGPVVIIVGAGVGGLILGAQFERLGIQYHIFERAAEVRPLGSAMTLGPNILPVFEQLGILDDLKKISLPCPSLNVFDTNMNKLGNVNVVGQKESGYNSLIFARPRLYELLRKQVPDSKISHGKKILGVKEENDKVIINCSDNSVYEGDLLIGADGAYSGVRQSLYKTMDAQGILPKEDLEGFYIGYISMVGVATISDPEKYPQLKSDIAHFTTVLGGENKRWNVTNVPGNQVCWAASTQLSSEEAKEQHFRNSEWGPEANEAMLKEFENKPCPWGGIMKDVFDQTPKDMISRVFFEEKVFKTWYHGRTVLIGDACHKMLPAAGLGAVNVMQDAVVLVNCLYKLKEYSVSNLTGAFEEYYKQRYQRSVNQVKESNTMGKFMGGQTWTERAIRHVVFNYIPNSIHAKRAIKAASYRPQIAWLPYIENRGEGPVLPQEPPREEEGEKASH